MRVTMHSTTGEACGVADYTRDLVAGLDGTVDLRMVPITERARNPVAMLGVARRLGQGDIAHIQHNYGFWGRGSLGYRVAFETLMRALRVPAVVTAHSVRSPASRFRSRAKRIAAGLLGVDRFIDRGTFALADRVIVHSRAQRLRLLGRGIAADRLVEIMPGAPALDRPSVGQVDRFRSTWTLDGKVTVALFGFIQSNKGCEVAVDALSHLPETYVLLLIGGVRTPGEAWYARALTDRVAALGLIDRVRVTGFLPRAEVAVALAASDLCVLPYAADDNVSYSARVCLAAGKPLLASALDAFAELRERFRCVELFTPNVPEALAAAIHALAADEAGRAALAEAARTYRRDRAWARVAADTVRVYHDALERR
jgi:glycosyltransferase involved in cell wall biosynthesis